jgi:hypothetical protein
VRENTSPAPRYQVQEENNEREAVATGAAGLSLKSCATLALALSG